MSPSDNNELPVRGVVAIKYALAIVRETILDLLIYWGNEPSNAERAAVALTAV
jgi:hypothetical protein